MEISFAIIVFTEFRNVRKGTYTNLSRALGDSFAFSFSLQFEAKTKRFSSRRKKGRKKGEAKKSSNDVVQWRSKSSKENRLIGNHFMKRSLGKVNERIAS